MKRYCKATLNFYFNKIMFVDDKNFYLYDIFLKSNRNLTTKHVKIV